MYATQDEDDRSEEQQPHTVGVKILQKSWSDGSVMVTKAMELVPGGQSLAAVGKAAQGQAFEVGHLAVAEIGWAQG